MTSPTHPKTTPYLRSGIFDGLKNFRELEACISALAIAKERGDAFEVFAEAYLDLALFDEANQTAGRAGVHFGFALADQNLPIRQRLFLTATPRHYDVRHRDREGDARLVYSMDALEVCGPRRASAHLRRSRPARHHLPLPGRRLRGHF